MRPASTFFNIQLSNSRDISVQIIEDCEKKGVDLIGYAKEWKED